MAYLNTPEKAAEWLADIRLTVLHTEQGEFTPDHIKYHCLLSNDSKEFQTAYQSNPSVHGEPTVTQVMEALVSDATSAEDYDLDDFVDSLGYEKPSQGIKAYESCKKALEWLRTDLNLSRSDIAELSQVLDEDGSGVDSLVSGIQSERDAKAAFENPPVDFAVDGTAFCTIDQLCEDLDLGDWGDQCPDYGDDYVGDVFSSVADDNVDIYHHDLLKWLPDNYEWLEEAEAQGLLEGCKGDLMKMTQTAQYVCYSQDMYEHRDGICAYAALQGLKEQGVYAVSVPVAEELLSELSDEQDRLSDYLDTAETYVSDAIKASFETSYDEDLAEEMADRVTDSYGVPNPVAMGKEAVRRVNEVGYDAAFEESWHDLLVEHGAVEPDGGTPTLDSAAKESRAASVGLSDREPSAPETTHDAPDATGEH